VFSQIMRETASEAMQLALLAIALDGIKALVAIGQRTAQAASSDSPMVAVFGVGAD